MILYQLELQIKERQLLYGINKMENQYIKPQYGKIEEQVSTV